MIYNFPPCNCDALSAGSQWQDQCAETHWQHHHLSLLWPDSEAVGQRHQESGTLQTPQNNLVIDYVCLLITFLLTYCVYSVFAAENSTQQIHFTVISTSKLQSLLVRGVKSFNLISWIGINCFMPQLSPINTTFDIFPYTNDAFWHLIIYMN